jgi:hypothetical protein
MRIAGYCFITAGLGSLVAAAGCGTDREFGEARGGSGGAAGSGGSGTGATTPSAGRNGAGDSSTAEGGASSCTPDETTPCYEAADGTSYGDAPPSDQKTCKRGEKACQADGTWGACAGAVGPAAADTCEPGNDANCNGTPNEGCPCKSGEKRACSSGGADCTPGEQTCADEVWGECVGEVCKVADGEPCVSAADCTSGVCTSFYADTDKDGYRADTQVLSFCGATKTGYVAVANDKGVDDCDDKAAAVNPGATEICDGIDNDCDQKIDLADGLKLSGQAKSIGTGASSAIVGGGALYGVAFSGDKTYFEVIDQKAAIKVPATALGVRYSAPGIGWDGTNFGIFYPIDYSNWEFRKATPAGAFLPASPVPIAVSGSGGGADPATVAHNGTNWFFATWSLYATGDWVYGYTVNSSYYPSDYLDLDINGGRWPSLATSGNQFAVVWHDGDYGNSGTTPPQTVELSLRDSAGAQTKHVQVRDTAAGARKPVIAARAGGGYVVVWSESAGIYVQEFNTAGASLCAPAYQAFANFEPDQMVPSNKGYLVVSGAKKVVKMQEVLPGCKFGQQFANIGTGLDDANVAHIAAASGGFAVVWDENKYDNTKTIYARMFGPNLCD